MARGRRRAIAVHPGGGRRGRVGAFVPGSNESISASVGHVAAQLGMCKMSKPYQPAAATSDLPCPAEAVDEARPLQQSRRHSPRKADFLEYIAYLLRVDALHDLRKRAIIRATPDPNHKDDGKNRKRRKSKWAKSVSDFAGVTRVLGVYHMAIVRFKGDLDLWFRYLEFCRHKRHGRMKEVDCGCKFLLAFIFRAPPNIPEVKITEDLAVNVARSLRYEINRAFASLRGLVKAVT
ncbi:hypothetical protein ACQ4PT_028536 [Festuca glaucescens]